MEKEILNRATYCNGNVMFEEARVKYDENRIYSLYLEFSTGQHGWADFEKNKLSRERILYHERPIMQYLDSVMANSFLNCECKYKVFKSDEIVREGGFVFKSK